MNRGKLPLTEQREELGLAQTGLPEHRMKQWRGDIAAHLMTKADLENLAGRKRFFPGLVLLGSDQSKAATLKDHPEFPVGGRRHLAFEQRSGSFGGGVGAKGLDIRSVGGAVRTSAEPVELGHVLFSVVQGPLDQVVPLGVPGLVQRRRHAASASAALCDGTSLCRHSDPRA